VGESGMVNLIQIINITNTFFLALCISWMVLFQQKYKWFKDDKVLVFVSIMNVVLSLINVIAMQFV